MLLLLAHTLTSEVNACTDGTTPLLQHTHHKALKGERGGGRRQKPFSASEAGHAPFGSLEQDIAGGHGVGVGRQERYGPHQQVQIRA